MKIVTTCVIFAAAVFGTVAYADDGGRHGGSGGNGDNGQNGQNSFSSSVIGSTPGVMVGGVASGGAPWVITQGSASVSSNGRIEVNVMGLLLGPGAPSNLVGTTGPVQMVAASLICGGSGGMVAASTMGVFLNPSGTAQIEDTITLPASCLAPVVLLRIFNQAGAPGAQLGAFIASTGLMPSSNANHGNNGHDDDN